MNYLRQLDMLVEMLDLCQQLIAELRHQLSYFKASVYKHEAQENIDSKIQILGILIGIIGDEVSKDLWEDFCSSKLNSNCSPPGECSFSLKVGILLGGLDEALNCFYNQITLKATEFESPEKIAESIRVNKSKILTVCNKNSKQYSIFLGI
jgi:hypothetical protein